VLNTTGKHVIDEKRTVASHCSFAMHWLNGASLHRRFGSRPSLAL